jgi:hypothetical protein
MLLRLVTYFTTTSIFKSQRRKFPITVFKWYLISAACQFLKILKHTHTLDRVDPVMSLLLVQRQPNHMKIRAEVTLKASSILNIPEPIHWNRHYGPQEIGSFLARFDFVKFHRPLSTCSKLTFC